MQIDIEKIKKRFMEINDAVSEIERIASFDDKYFWSDKKHIAAIKYYLLQAIEGVGSVCVHISAKKFNKGVSAFGECFEVLEEEGVLKGRTADRLRRMVKFRNKLIHIYWEVDDKMVLQYSRKNIGDFQEFIKAIGKIL